MNKFVTRRSSVLHKKAAAICCGFSPRPGREADFLSMGRSLIERPMRPVDYRDFCRIRIPRPAKPRPNNTRVPGSGTGVVPPPEVSAETGVTAQLL